jgi:hypothetical protein
MWWPWVDLEVLCEFATYSHGYRDEVERVTYSARFRGLNPEIDGVKIPWKPITRMNIDKYRRKVIE